MTYANGVSPYRDAVELPPGYRIPARIRRFISHALRGLLLFGTIWLGEGMVRLLHTVIDLFMAPLLPQGAAPLVWSVVASLLLKGMAASGLMIVLYVANAVGVISEALFGRGSCIAQGGEISRACFAVAPWGFAALACILLFDSLRFVVH